MKKIRVRYAPSPTGYLHIGNARTALYVYLFSQNSNGDMIFRTENTDINRNTLDGEKSQIENLKWLGINWQEGPDIGGGYGPYRQLDRLNIYKKITTKLLDEGYAYKCFCTTDELEESRQKQKQNGIGAPKYNRRCLHLSEEELNKKKHLPYTIRIKSPDEEIFKWNDIARGEITFKSKDIEDWIIVKSDGMPTYNYCCAIDDYYMNITHVLRGEEHISNTPKQLMIYKILGWDCPKYCHLSVIVNQEGKKLSKRDENVIQFIHQYKNKGYLPQSLFNFISLLGFSPKECKEILDKKELIEEFNINKLSPSPAFFDVKKLNWINSQYINKINDEELLNLCKPFIEDKFLKNKKWIIEVLNLYKEQLKYGEEIKELAKFFFEDYELSDSAKKYIDNSDISNFIYIADLLKDKINKLDFDNENIISNIKTAIKEIENTTKLKGKNLFMPIRILIMADTSGPSLISVIKLIGKEKSMKNINSILTFLRCKTNI